jgi:hypothetical protein
VNAPAAVRGPFALLHAIAATALAACSAAGPAPSDVVKVELIQTDTGFTLARDGRPYVIHGAGIDGGSVEAMVLRGGNSYRTWRTGGSTKAGMKALDEAAELGVTVVLCIEIGRERHGFDYDDELEVVAQFEFAKQEVLKYRNHPALLAWMIGNEPNLEYTNPKVFDAVNDISLMIHELDPNHPTTTALAGFSGELAAILDARAPDLDFLSIQMYGDIVNLPRYIAESGFDRPYLVTEWGAIGHWEVQKTSWGAPIEQHSSAKAQTYLRSYDTVIRPNPEQILGSYVFLWGQKQERTPTWYGMFLESGEQTEAVDVMQYIWNGEWPENRTPRLESMLLDGSDAYQDVTLLPGKSYSAMVNVVDPDADPITYRWELRAESDATQTGGDQESVPPVIAGHIDNPSQSRIELQAPQAAGAYRLFVYAFDGHGNAAHANIPFLVAKQRN